MSADSRSPRTTRRRRAAVDVPAEAPPVPTVRLWIPHWHPAKKNALKGHWSNQHTHKRSDRVMIASYACVAQRTTATRKRRLTLHIILDKGQRGGDPDAYFESLNDALVHAGLLVNDSREWVELPPVIFSRNPDRWGTLIILEDLS